MKPKVITINREFGSNGREVGRLLAEKLKVHFYDKVLLKMVQENCDIPYEELIKVDETAASKWRFPVDSEYQMQNKFHFEPVNDILFHEESKLIRELAAKEPCVIVGRCSNYLLKDIPDHLSVFVYAPVEERIRTVIERDGIDEETARALVKKIDKQRRMYYNYHTDEKWTDMEQYDLCVDSSRFSLDEIVNMITEL